MVRLVASMRSAQRGWRRRSLHRSRRASVFWREAGEDSCSVGAKESRSLLQDRSSLGRGWGRTAPSRHGKITVRARSDLKATVRLDVRWQIAKPLPTRGSVIVGTRSPSRLGITHNNSHITKAFHNSTACPLRSFLRHCVGIGGGQKGEAASTWLPSYDSSISSR